MASVTVHCTRASPMERHGVFTVPKPKSPTWEHAARGLVNIVDAVVGNAMRELREANLLRNVLLQVLLLPR